MTGKAKGTLYVLVCVALWGLIPVVAKLGQAELDNHQFLFWSSLVSFVVLFINAAATRTLAEVRSYAPRQWSWLLLLGLLGTYIYYLFLYLGYARAGGLEVLVVQYTWPVLIVVLSVVLLGERLTLRKLAAIAMGFLGVLLVLTKGDFSQVKVNNPEVILLVGTGAFCFALFSVLSKRVDSTPSVAVVVYFLAALIASFLSMLCFSKLAVPSAREVLAILLNGALINGYSYIFWVKALASTEASHLAPFTYIAPVLSAFYLVVFFDEQLLSAYLAGLALVIASGLINSLQPARAGE